MRRVGPERPGLRMHADLRNKSYREWISFLRAAEGWDRGKIAAYQLAELKRVLTYAYHRSQMYRSLYDRAQIRPEDVRTDDDFRKLPFVEKKLIRDNLMGFSVKIKGAQYVTTGGSTGIPFGFYRDRVAFARELASKAHQYYRVGWKEGDRQLVFRGLPIRGRNHMQFYPRLNELRCSSYHLTPEYMEVYRQRAFTYKPDWIRCYPSSGFLFAKFLKENDRPFPRLKGILCASENLYDFQKQLLSDVFQCRVFSHYGHYEMAVLAGFCEYEDSYHVLPQYGFAELVAQNGCPVTRPGEIGEIVGTSFIMGATPFIRYKTGDFAVLKGWECSACGRPYQIWERVEGRLQEFIITGEGRFISMTAINMHDNIFDHVRQFQFFQEEKGKVEFRFIPRETCNANQVEEMRRRLLLKLGTDVQLEMLTVDDIPLTARGKHRFLIQKLNLGFPTD